MTTTPTTPQFQVLYLDGARGWTPTNLGAFGSREEATEAAGNWKTGYATTHGGTRPPTRVEPVRGSIQPHNSQP